MTGVVEEERKEFVNEFSVEALGCDDHATSDNPQKSKGKRIFVNFRRVFLLLLIAWIVAITVLSIGAYGDLRKGQALLNDISGQTRSHEIDVDKLSGNLEQAANVLRDGHNRLANPIFWPLRYIPIAGRQLSSLTALSGSGSQVADAGADLLKAGDASSAQAKADQVAALRTLSALTLKANTELDKVDFGPNRALMGPLARTRDDAIAKSATLKEVLTKVSAGSAGVAQMLETPGHYLVIAANSAEMRAGSGMFLSVGEMNTGSGKIELSDMRTVGGVQAPKGTVKWTGDLNDRWGWLGMQNDLRNLMASPRFDVSAPLAAEVWNKSKIGNEVQGVMVLDPIMLKSLLSATGPVQTGAKTINADNVIKELLFEQYKVMDGTTKAQKNRRDGLSDVAKATFSSLNAGNWNPVVLGKELGKAASGRHVMLWSRDEELNEKWRTAGLSGSLEPNSMMLNLVNLGGNKLDQFINIDASVGMVTGRSGLDFSVSVKLTNNAPASGPKYVLGPFPGSGLKAGQYQGALAFNVPSDSTGVRFDGNPTLWTLGADGPTQTIATELRLDPGESKTMVLRFTRNALARTTIVESSARIPATTWHFKGNVWRDDHKQVIAH